MPITMYNKKTGKNIKVYGFVTDGLCGANVKAITYMPDDLTYELGKKLHSLQHPGEPYDKECELVLELVNARDLRPIE